MAGIAERWLRFRPYVALLMAGLYIAALARLAAGHDWHNPTGIRILEAICISTMLLMLAAMPQAMVVTGWRSRPRARSAVVLLVGGLGVAGVITQIATALDGNALGFELCQMSAMVLALSWISGVLPNRSQASSSQQPRHDGG